MKKYVSKLMALLMIFMMIPIGVVSAETSDIEVVNIVKPTNQVNENDIFLVGLTLKNNTDEELKEIKVQVGGAYYVINSDPVKEYKTISAGAKNFEVEPFELRYKGDSNTNLIIKINYKLGGVEKSKVVYVPIDAAPSEDGNNVPNDTKAYKPQITLGNGEQPVVRGEKVSDVIIKLQNASEYKAENVKVTGMFSSSKFELAEISPIKQKSVIKKNGEFLVNFKVKGKSDEKSGVYPVNFKCSYTNVYGDSFNEEFEVYIKYIAEETETNVDVIDNDEYQKLISGEQFDLDLKVKNDSKEAINDILVQLVELDGEKIINKFSSNKRIEKIEAGQAQDVKITMISNSELVTGNYPIKVEVSYKDINGKEKKVEKTFYKKVELTNSELFIKGIISSNQILQPEEGFKVTIPVVNYGEKAAENVKVSIKSDADIMCETSSAVLIQKIEAGEKKDVEFSLKMSPKASQGNKNITVKVTEGKTAVEDSINIYSEGNEEGSESEPKLIISRYKPIPLTDDNQESDSVTVKAGQEFELDLSFLNSHYEKTIRNIKITLTTSVTDESEKNGSVFTPVNSSNTFFIDTIEAKQESDMKIKLYTIPDAQSKTYSVDVNMEYEDENGKAYKAKDLIGVPVRQQSKFMTSDINVPAQSVVNEAVRLDLTISNTGKIDLMNFTVKVEGDFNTNNSQTYIGKITPGGQEYYDVDLMPSKEGLNSGKFIFSYEEPDGNLVEETVEFSSTASAPYVPEYNPGENGIENGRGDLENPSKGFPKVIIIVGGVVLVAIILIVVLRKRAKKKKEMELDE